MKSVKQVLSICNSSNKYNVFTKAKPIAFCFTLFAFSLKNQLPNKKRIFANNYPFALRF